MKHVMFMASGAALVAASSAIAGVPSSAAAFEVPSFRGDTNTQYAGWESFATPIGFNNPTDPATTNFGAGVVQDVAPDFSMPPGVLITSAGNLYSGFQIINVGVLAGSGNGQDLTDVTLQVRTLGTELDTAGVVLIDTDAFGPPIPVIPAATTELFRQSDSPIFPGFPSEIVETRFDFNLTGLGISNFVIGLPQQQAHISFDRIELDTAFVPTPGALAVLGVAGLTAVRRRR
ncbi:MAG: hypothetical protein AAGD00_08780 [Planctomycetota bacterium]